MAHIVLQNESEDTSSPAADTVSIYPVNDTLRVQNSAGEVKTLLTADEDYAYLFGDADTDDSVRYANASGSVTLQKRVGGEWVDLQAHTYEV